VTLPVYHNARVGGNGCHINDTLYSLDSYEVLVEKNYVMHYFSMFSMEIIGGTIIMQVEDLLMTRHVSALRSSLRLTYM
jgi:hypothetical protein